MLHELQHGSAKSFPTHVQTVGARLWPLPAEVHHFCIKGCISEVPLSFNILAKPAPLSAVHKSSVKSSDSESAEGHASSTLIPASSKRLGRNTFYGHYNLGNRRHDPIVCEIGHAQAFRVHFVGACNRQGNPPCFAGIWRAILSTGQDRGRSTFLAIGPSIVISSTNPPGGRMWPSFGTRPAVGINPTSAAEMARHPDASPCVATNVKRRASRRNNGGGATATAAGSQGEIMRIVRASVDEIVRFIRHREFRSIRLAKENCACTTKSGNHGSILFGDKRCPTFCSARADNTSRIEIVLNGHWHTVERSPRLAASERIIRPARLRERCFRSQVDNRVQPGIHELDTTQMRFHNLQGRKFLVPNGTSKFEWPNTL